MLYDARKHAALECPLVSLLAARWLLAVRGLGIIREPRWTAELERVRIVVLHSAIPRQILRYPAPIFMPRIFVFLGARLPGSWGLGRLVVR